MPQIYHRCNRGHTADPRFARRIEGLRVCAAAADQAIDKRRIDRLFE